MSKKRGDFKDRLKKLAAKDENESPEHEQISTTINPANTALPEPEGEVKDEIQSPQQPPETNLIEPDISSESTPEEANPETAAEMQLQEPSETDPQPPDNEDSEEPDPEPVSAPPEGDEKLQKPDAPKRNPRTPRAKGQTDSKEQPDPDQEQKASDLVDKKMSVTTVRLTNRHKDFLNYHIDTTIDLARKFGYKSKNFSQESPHFRSSLEIYSRLITSADWQQIFESWDGTSPLEHVVNNYLIDKLRKHKVPLNNEL